MQLFYAPDLVPPEHTLDEEESKHCVRVLRLDAGDAVDVTDGRGNLYRCELVEAHPKRCRLRVVACRQEYEKSAYRLTMAVAPTKNADRFEWFLEKATEVGVGEIVPLETEHSERRSFKAERGERGITAAMN
ncbi:MAG: RsmE family RNA methyltransferase, partial [Alistipes sp.]|nr:RsmE family RNA methyltransferase [Alistipes sp.]